MPVVRTDAHIDEHPFGIYRATAYSKLDSSGSAFTPGGGQLRERAAGHTTTRHSSTYRKAGQTRPRYPCRSLRSLIERPEGQLRAEIRGNKTGAV